jgi:two-component system CheB/CheR fusion protein
MRKMAEWIRGTLASRREANRQLAGNVAPGAALLFGRNTEPTPVAARRASEPGFRGLPLAEDGIFLVDAESGNVLDTRRKDEFLATISHELRSPLASIQNAVRLLSIQVGENHARQRAQAMIERQVRRMTQLVDDLLDLSRISHGRMHLRCERIDLREVLRNAIETLESDINERNHHLTTAVPDGPVWLNADPLRLEQVFVNLLANASRYTDVAGELSVLVHTRDDQAVVRIRDSGIGIAPNALPYIFDLFRQADEAAPYSRSGLGIGLAVVRSLVELHGGSVTAVSAGLGRGSEFTVSLPRET